MAGCAKCDSKKAYWTIKDKEGKTEDYYDQCFKKYDLADYKKEMDEYHNKKKKQEEEAIIEKRAKERETLAAKHKETLKSVKSKYPKGGFDEPYCSDRCYGLSEIEIARGLFTGIRGVCAFCQKSVYLSFNNMGGCGFFPFRQKLIFVCKSCHQKGKEYSKNIGECVMCGKEIQQ